MAAPGDRLVEFVVVSTRHSAEELTQLLGPPDRPEVRGRLQDPREVSWSLGSGLSAVQSPGLLLSELADRVKERLDEVASEIPDSVRAILRIVQYLPHDQLQVTASESGATGCKSSTG